MMKEIYAVSLAFALLATSRTFCFATIGSAPLFSSPENLKAVSSTPIYSIEQDAQGAVWLNTGFGLCRYDGNKIDYKTKPLPMHMIYSSPDGMNIYAVSSETLYQFNVTKSEPLVYRSCGRDLSNCTLVWLDDRPVIGIGHEICVPDADSLKTLSSYDTKGSFISGILSSDGKILLSTNQAEILKIDTDFRLLSSEKGKTSVSVFFRSNGGALWAGTSTHGLVLLDEESLILEHVDIGPCYEDLTWPEIRTIAEGAEGRLYLGTAKGLHCVDFSKKGERSFQTESFYIPWFSSIPVCSVFKDRDNSLWVGTFYNGVLYSSSESIPFDIINHPDGNTPRLIKASVPLDDENRVLLFTDGNGVFLLDLTNGSTRLIPGIPHLKYQSACKCKDEIIAVDYTSEILVISDKDLSYKRSDSRQWKDKTLEDRFNCIDIYNDELYAGGNKGVYKLDIKAKTIIRLNQSNTRALNIRNSGRGSLLVAGDGLYEWNGKELFCLKSTGDFTDAVYGRDGTLWATSTGLGLLRTSPAGEETFYDSTSSGLGSDFLSSVTILNENMLALGTRAGISVLDCNSGVVCNYSSVNGLALGSNLARSIKRIGDKFIFGGTAGPAVLNASQINTQYGHTTIDFEKITVNGEDLKFSDALHCIDNITLENNQNNFKVTIATFDYHGILSGVLSYRLEGYDSEWNPLNKSEQIIYKNLRPGKYLLKIRSVSGDQVIEKSLGIRVKPDWWQNWWVIVFFALLLSAMLFFLLKTTYSKIVLSEKLKNKERENEERTRYFVRISRSLRNPLSLIIGQLETSLRSGIGSSERRQIESAYKNAEQLQKILSDYESIENQVAEAESARYVQPSRLSITEARFHEYRMLIVDENDEIREMLRTIFASQYDIIEAQDGEDAWQIAKSEVPDIIISDLVLPGLSGTELCMRLRQNFETNHIAIILLTAHASEQSGLIGMTSGADDYITKPFNIKILEARCRNLLKSRKVLMEKYSLAGVEKRSESNFAPGAKFLNAAIGAIERNISNPEFNVGRLCEELCTSKTGLTNKLHEAVGMSPRDFIEDLRLRKAAQCLLDGEESITEIADKFCFCSAKYFSLRFRGKFGVVPSRYAASVRPDSGK